MNLCYATGVQQRFVTKCTKLSKQWIALNKYNCTIVYAFDAFYFKRTNISSSLTEIDYQNISFYKARYIPKNGYLPMMNTEFRQPSSALWWGIMENQGIGARNEIRKANFHSVFKVIFFKYCFPSLQHLIFENHHNIAQTFFIFRL